jgi:hypothetical protein
VYGGELFRGEEAERDDHTGVVADHTERDGRDAG